MAKKENSQMDKVVEQPEKSRKAQADREDTLLQNGPESKQGRARDEAALAKRDESRKTKEREMKSGNDNRKCSK
jgi:hypothetical protein